MKSFADCNFPLRAASIPVSNSCDAQLVNKKIQLYNFLTAKSPNITYLQYLGSLNGFDLFKSILWARQLLKDKYQSSILSRIFICLYCVSYTVQAKLCKWQVQSKHMNECPYFMRFAL